MSCSELPWKSSTSSNGQTNTDEPPNEGPNTPSSVNVYMNAVALAAEEDGHANRLAVNSAEDAGGKKCKQLPEIYQELNVEQGAAEPALYEKIRPKKIPRTTDSDA